jgi:flagellar basal-body rod modification protein FlgD
MQSIQQILSGQQMSNSATAVASSLSKPRAAATAGTSSTSSGSSSASSSSASSTITANDFLTLLVAEMKNQDPTQPTDPSQYISQMVDVNSLQQLVSINQGITSLDSAAGATTPAAGSTGS